MTLALRSESIDARIVTLRGYRVMISTDVATLYGVEPRVLVQAVKRNAERFPSDFMFHLTPAEASDLKSHSVIPSWGGARTAPYAFTQEGVAMLSSVLRSPQAVRVNIEIMRAFVRLRRLVVANEGLARCLAELEQKYDRHDRQFKAVFDAIRVLMTPPEVPQRPSKARAGPSATPSRGTRRGLRRRFGAVSSATSWPHRSGRSAWRSRRSCRFHSSRLPRRWRSAEVRSPG